MENATKEEKGKQSCLKRGIGLGVCHPPTDGKTGKYSLEEEGIQ